LQSALSMEEKLPEVSRESHIKHLVV